MALVEGAVAQRVFVAVDGFDLPAVNVFGEPLVTERGTDVAELTRKCALAAEAGERATLVARSADLAAVRSELASISARRLDVVVHALGEPRGGGHASAAGLAPALALDDLLWGMLLSAGVSDAIDLALVARRAAEDSGCPFFVVHEGTHAHDVEPIAAPSRALCEALLGPGRGRSRPEPVYPPTNPGLRRRPGSTQAGDRAFAERVPFALASALRQLEGLTGRHHDVIERAPASDAAVCLVGAGALGDSLIADVDRLRADGHDVAAVRVVAWRPFPAPRLVKALGRALAITVLERVDQPLAGGAPLSVELKAAFADALTWAPDFPGIGRIPRIVSGIVSPEREVDSRDLDAIVHNVLADERGKRTFVLGGDEAHALRAPEPGSATPSEPAPSPSLSSSPGAFVMRGVVLRPAIAAASAELCAAVLTSALGLRTRVAVRQLPEEEGGGVAFDLVASRQRPRGAHAPHTISVIALGSASLLSRGNPLLRLARSGVVAMQSERRAADALWSEVPPWAKAVVFDRGARVVGWRSPGDHAEGAEAASGDRDEPIWLAAAGFVGIALAAAASDRGLRGLGVGEGVDGAVVEREVAEALRGGVAFHAKGAASAAEAGGKAARAVFEAIVEVPRATIERDDDGVRLGRRARNN